MQSVPRNPGNLRYLGFDIEDCCPDLWIPPFTCQERCIGRTLTTWFDTVPGYQTITIGKPDQWDGEVGWLCEYRTVYLGLSHEYTMEYLRKHIPLGVPTGFYFPQAKLTEEALGKIEGAQVADILEISIAEDAAGTYWAIKAVVYDLEGFVNILKQLDWVQMWGGDVGG